jgi:hypothetical protein
MCKYICLIKQLSSLPTGHCFFKRFILNQTGRNVHFNEAVGYAVVTGRVTQTGQVSAEKPDSVPQ